MTAPAMLATPRCKWALTLFAASLLIPALCAAQQSSGPPPEQGSSATQLNAGESSSTSRAAVETQAPAPDPYPVRTIGGAGLLTRRPGDIGFGPIYIYSADAFQVVNYRSRFDSLLGQDVTDRFNSSVFRTNIAFDHRFRRGRLALQYQPRLVILNGNAQPDYTNQRIGLDTTLALTPRLSLGISQSAFIYGSRDQFGDLYIDSDPTSGHVLENPIASGTGRWVYTTTSVPLIYHFSARTRLVAAPRFEYAHISEEATLLAPRRSRGVGSRFEFLHALNARRTIGVYQDLDWQDYTGVGPDTSYVSTGFEYMDEIRPTWFIYSMVGAASFTRVGGGRDWTPEARLSLIKAFKTSRLTLAFGRTHSSSGYISSRYHNRYDLGYSVRIGPRVAIDLGGGYFREKSTIEELSGTYASGRFRYQLFRQVNWFSMYTYRQQTGNSVQVPAERRNYFITGIQWTSTSASDPY